MAMAACYVMWDQPWTMVALYTVSCLLDALDGHAARYYQQCIFPYKWLILF